MKHRSTIIVGIIALLIIGALVYLYGYRKRQVSADLATVQQKSQDVATTSKVKMALELNKHVSHLPIDVSASSGVVTLAGKVPTDQDKILIGQIAKDTEGVKEVINHISVEPTPEAIAQAEKERAMDLEIKAAVLEKFWKSPELRQESAKIDVEVLNRVVKLSGSVPTPELKSRASMLVRSVSGVQEVNDAGVSVSSPVVQYPNR